MATTIDKAEVTLPGETEVRVVRSFRAPRALVYRAYTEPALIRRWMLGPPGWTMPVCEMDLRVGGAYRWGWRSDADGSEFGFAGTFREVVPGTRIVHTQVFHPGDARCQTGAGTSDEMGAGGQAIVTLSLSESAGITTVTTLIDFGTRESRDAAVATGMTDGMEQGHQRLDRMFADELAG